MPSSLATTPWPDFGTIAATLARLARAALPSGRRSPPPPDAHAALPPRRHAADTPPSGQREPTIPRTGTVHLVGAGPGDPDLLTVAAVRALGAADVVLYDDLVGPGILDLARPAAARVYVGKRAGRHSHGQEAINQLLIAYARSGRTVVRLKGGDPMLFGRAGEEIDELQAAGIPVRVVPGVTAALGCAAGAGISLTRRGVARRVTFVTAHHRAGDGGGVDWSRLADPEATLAVYMGRDQLARIAEGLMAGGLAPDTPALIVENGTRPDERRIPATLRSLGRAAAMVGGGPALLFVGRAIPCEAEAPEHSMLSGSAGP